jgi:hypothetical protein
MEVYPTSNPERLSTMSIYRCYHTRTSRCNVRYALRRARFGELTLKHFSSHLTSTTSNEQSPETGEPQLDGINEAQTGSSGGQSETGELGHSDDLDGS